jgi:acyl-coenzyme A synthetase/AMP-(fatty) acid ligase
LRKGHDTNAEHLREWINHRVEAKYQKVSNVIILDDFPRNVAGKTLKRVIRDHHLAR